jgi:hypothetical protein
MANDMTRGLGHLARPLAPPDPGAQSASFPMAREVLFCVPVISARLSDDWARIERNLGRTLGTLLRQTDRNWRAVVACHEVPDLVEDPRIRALPVDRPLDGDDKWAKITAILRKEAPGPDTLLFALDADDLLHPGLVAHMRAEPADGWLLSRGWSVDATTGDVGLHGDPTPDAPRRCPLWHACGSAGAVRMVPGDIAATRQMMVRHFELPSTAAAHGQRLRPLPFPGVAYLVAHGENMESRAGREEDKRRYVAANRASGEEAAGMRRLLALPEGPLR